MKNVSSLKSNKTDSPKTPGGISKSLLTPCRRVGLSRNWKKAGPSPFLSPLTSNQSPQPEHKVEKHEPRKRKHLENYEENEPEIEESNLTPTNFHITFDENKSNVSSPQVIRTNEIVCTPSRHVILPRKKKSKLLSAINTKFTEKHETLSPKQDINSAKKDIQVKVSEIYEKQVIDSSDSNEFTVSEVVTPVRTISKSKNIQNNKLLVHKTPKDDTVVHIQDIPNNKDNRDDDVKESIKTRSPNELTKECIVVIQKKIFKADKKRLSSNNTIEAKKIENNKQSIKLITEKFDEIAKKSVPTFDSDSDDIALCHIQDKKNVEYKNKLETENIDDDFEENGLRVSKLKDKTTSVTGLKSTPKSSKIVKSKYKTPVELSSQSSYDDDDDFEFQTKKTILIRKSYDKVSKPLKARSTGSITQRDIDQLRSKIESKKKLLLAKAVCNDTEELRDLIKKWQRGCQDALMELMELMKHKFQDKQNMDYAEMLKSLKIPANLVGYDEENDCFTTPDDANIILSKFNKL